MITRAISDPARQPHRRVRTAIMAGLGVLAAAGCGKSEPLCINNVIRGAVSPDGQMKATLFQRACGVTTGKASQVSVMLAGETETGKGNAFIVDIGGGAPAGAWGGPDVALEWTSPQALVLSYSSRVRIILAEPSVHGVAITHKLTD